MKSKASGWVVASESDRGRVSEARGKRRWWGLQLMVDGRRRIRGGSAGGAGAGGGEGARYRGGESELGRLTTLSFRDFFSGSRGGDPFIVCSGVLNVTSGFRFALECSGLLATGAEGAGYAGGVRPSMPSM